MSLNFDYKKVAESDWEVAAEHALEHHLHKSNLVWVMHWPLAKTGLFRTGMWQAYTATEPVPPGRKPWNVDNRRIGCATKGYATEALAKAAALAHLEAFWRANKNRCAITHLALGLDGVVAAHFASSDAAADFCRQQGLTHVPFNTRLHTPPAVGEVYKA